jgi:hypothetical protein
MDEVYVSDVPQFLMELRDRICDTVLSVNEVIIIKVWAETAFRFGMCYINCGSPKHLETKA